MQKTLPTLILAAVLAASAFTYAHPMTPAAAQQSHVASGRVLVKFATGVSAAQVAREVAHVQAKVIDEVAALDVKVLQVPQGHEEQVATALAHNPRVEYAEADGLSRAVMSVNDPYFAPNQWGLENTGQVIVGQPGQVDADVNSASAWDVATGQGVKVAILDTGIDQDHPDVSGKIVLQRNFTTAASVDDFYGHGTHVGGTVAAVANNGVGVAGGCPGCLLMNGKVLGDDGSGANSWIANGITWAADNGAQVINMSLGSSSPSRTLERAVNYAWNKGVVLAAAAGNSGSTAKLYPAAYTNVLAVAATNNLDQRASFSNYGSKWVDVAAPGENIFATFPNHPFAIQQSHGRSLNYDFASGTSMATPMVAATAALVWSSSHGTSAQAVRQRVEATADAIAGTGRLWSAGRVNAARAVAP